MSAKRTSPGRRRLWGVSKERQDALGGGVHERDAIVAKANAELFEAAMKCVEVHELTAAELQSIVIDLARVIQIQTLWAERKPKEAEHG